MRPVKILTLQECLYSRTPPPFAPPMEAFYVPSKERVIEAVRSLF